MSKPLPPELTELGFMSVSPADPDEWTGTCPECGFDALLRFPLTVLKPSGVQPFGYVLACARCHDVARNKEG